MALLQTACGPEDYQKSIQQFQAAATVVINSNRAFLNNMNLIEQNEALDNVVFKREPLNLPALDKIGIITPEEIRIRTDALNALAQYTSDLAQLSQGKAGSSVQDSTTKLSTSLKALAGDAGKLPAAKGSVFDNSQFSGLASAASKAVGAVAELIVEHRARREIEKSVEKNDSSITRLMEQIGKDSTDAYLRQKSQLGAYGDQLSRDYQLELRRNADPVLLLILAKTIKNYRTQEAQLAPANPAPAIEAMKKAHEALVSYIRSNKNPKTLSQLVTAVQHFIAAAKPLGQAVEALTSAS